MPVDPVEQLTLLDKLRRKRDEQINALAAIVDKRAEERAAFEKREDDDDDKPTDEQRSTFAAAERAFGGDFAARDAEIRVLDQRIAEQEVIEERRKIAGRASGPNVAVISEPLTYRKDNARDVSYFRDLASTILTDVGNPAEARTRLQAHASEMAHEIPRREEQRARRAEELVDRAEREFTGSFLGLEARGLEASPFERRVNPSTTDGQGGYAIPPLYLIDEYIPGLRAGRVASGLVRQLPLPEGTNQIKIPRLATGTLVGAQTDNAPVVSQDLTDDEIEAGARTIAGQQDVAVQLLDQSPGDIMDMVIMSDLMADYNRQVDRDVVRAPGGAQRIKGIYPSANWGASTVATAAAAANSGQAFLQAQGAMVATLATRRFSTENVHLLMHPRRWYWWATSLDSGATGTTGRPLLAAGDGGPHNVAALHDGSPAEGRVGHAIFGPHGYYCSANVPTDDLAGVPGGGTQDPVLAAKWDDLWLFESSLRTRVLTEVLSGTLQVRFQVYGYVAFLARYGQSIVIARGAGLAPPTGSIDTAMVFGA